MSIVRPIVGALVSPLSTGSLPWEVGGGGALWTPARLTSLRGWYRADLGVTLVGSDVDAWADQSGNANHLSAAAAGNRPLYVSSSAVFGSQPCIEFDGVAEYLRDAAFDWGASAGPMTHAMIVQSVTVTANDQMLTYNGTSGRPILRQQATNTFGWIAQGAATSSAANGDLTAGGAAKLIGGWWDLSNQAVFVHTTEKGATASVAAAHADDQIMALGASAAGTVLANIRVAELVIMRAKITAAELSALASYAASRYGVS